MPALKEFYKITVVPHLKKELGVKNAHALPVIEKVIVHVGFGKHAKDGQYIENVKRTLRNITGQEAVDAAAKKSISNFKVREGNVIGAKVTLRGDRMYDFIERFIGVTLPRVPDFRGLKREIVDQNGNASVGLKDQIPFPESIPEDIHNPHGVQITVVTSATSHDEGLALLEAMGFPFKK